MAFIVQLHGILTVRIVIDVAYGKEGHTHTQCEIIDERMQLQQQNQ